MRHIPEVAFQKIDCVARHLHPLRLEQVEISREDNHTFKFQFTICSSSGKAHLYLMSSSCHKNYIDRIFCFHSSQPFYSPLIIKSRQIIGISIICWLEYKVCHISFGNIFNGLNMIEQVRQKLHGIEYHDPFVISCRFKN